MSHKNSNGKTRIWMPLRRRTKVQWKNECACLSATDCIHNLNGRPNNKADPALSTMALSSFCCVQVCNFLLVTKTTLPNDKVTRTYVRLLAPIRHLRREIWRQRLRFRSRLADQPQATSIETTISHVWRWRCWRHRYVSFTKGKAQDGMIALLSIRQFPSWLASWHVTDAQTKLFCGFNLRFSKCFRGRAPSWKRFQELFLFVLFRFVSFCSVITQ